MAQIVQRTFPTFVTDEVPVSLKVVSSLPIV
jgi:hypothetical protein